MRRWFVVVQLCARGIWREYQHVGHGEAFKFRADAEQFADKLRKRYTNPKRWHVVVVRRRVRK